jgi:hypothetical protein
MPFPVSTPRTSSTRRQPRTTHGAIAPYNTEGGFRKEPGHEKATVVVMTTAW